MYVYTFHLALTLRISNNMLINRSAFFLIMNVAVGGTNGWFPDNLGDKPWLDQSDCEYECLVDMT